MSLTDREKTILRCLAQGMQTKEIATFIGRSKPTVENHIRILYAKTNARSRAQLVALAMAALEEESRDAVSVN
ncbi:MAG TPA: helix-turn-helix transcriptional regulator [Candidatus Baltobacteraceae bacterium]|nr:helix-turn-helix transcriptional regulator [Candidatus Baltobacteraceae bacterium]